MPSCTKPYGQNWKRDVAHMTSSCCIQTLSGGSLNKIEALHWSHKHEWGEDTQTLEAVWSLTEQLQKLQRPSSGGEAKDWQLNYGIKQWRKHSEQDAFSAEKSDKLDSSKQKYISINLGINLAKKTDDVFVHANTPNIESNIVIWCDFIGR